MSIPALHPTGGARRPPESS